MDRVTNQLGEFKKFILRGNVVDLAVAVVIGAAFTGIVTSITNGIIKPILASFGSANLGQGLGFSLRSSTPELAKATFIDLGNLISTTLNFVIVAAVVFFVVVQPVNKLISLSNRNKKPAEVTTKKCPECLGEIPKAATRCQFCTTKFASKDVKAA